MAVTSGEGSTAWLFPGQGSQFVGMTSKLASFPATAVFDRAREVLGWDVRDIAEAGPIERLSATEVAQPSIFTVDVAAARVLEDAGASPDAVAGHSLGEFSALVVAGALDFEEALQAVSVRADAMGRAGRAAPGSMAAVIGLEADVVAQACIDAGGCVVVANHNTLDQTVISGEAASVQKAVELLRDEGARRVIRLSVSVAAHSPLMRDAAAELASAISRLQIHTPTVPFYSSVTGGSVVDPGRIAELLVQGVTAPVKWSDCMRALLDAGMRTFVEVGPGNVLGGLAKRIDRSLHIAWVGSDDEARALPAVGGRV